MVTGPPGLFLSLALGPGHEADLEDVGEADHGGGVQAEPHPDQVAQAVTLNVVFTLLRLLKRKDKCWFHHKNVAKN